MKGSDVRKGMVAFRGTTKASERVHKKPDGFISGRITERSIAAVADSMHKRLQYNERINDLQSVTAKIKVMDNDHLRTK